MIGELTRRDILDFLQESYESREFIYSGRLSESSFFSRLYNLSDMPSTDSRPQYNTAYTDIIQHRENNDDWEWDWFYHHYNDNFHLVDNDDKFTAFLCETVHPVVIDKGIDSQVIVNQYNEFLRHDRLKIIETGKNSGRSIYGIEKFEENQILTKLSSSISKDFNSDYIDQQIKMMMDNIDIDPSTAIGKSKELIESCAKTILNELGKPFKPNTEIIPLLRMVYIELGLDTGSQNKDNEVGKISVKILGNLASVVQNMAELRNHFGTGHGKNNTFKNVPPRYAELAVGASVILVRFIWETYKDKLKK